MPRVRVPATTANLGPGFDALGLALNLYDYVSVDWSRKGLEIEASGAGAEGIPRGPDNLAYRGAAAVFNALGREVPGLRLSLQINIPVARGLGSSAAALVGGVCGANHLLGEPLRRRELLQLASQIEGHPDNVAAALYGGLTVAAQDDDQTLCLRLKPPQDLCAVVAIPDFRLSTHAARSVLPESVSRRDAVFNLGRAALLVAAVAGNDLEVMGRAMEDRLHQPYRLHLVPGLEAVFRAARAAGALACVLSGSGPTAIAFCQERKTGVGEAMFQAFAAAGVACAIKELTPVPRGAELEN